MDNKRSTIPVQSGPLRTNAVATGSQQKPRAPLQQQISALEFDEARETLDSKYQSQSK